MEEKGILGGMFDFNRDGELDAFERAAEFGFLQEMIDDDCDDDEFYDNLDDDCDDDDFYDNLDDDFDDDDDVDFDGDVWD